MSVVSEVEIAALPPARFDSVLKEGPAREFRAAEDAAAGVFQGRTIWNINSTARGGGVAELLRSLVAYARGAGVDTRWLVIQGEPEFFAITKRVHNFLHDFEGDRGDLGEAEQRVYEAQLARNCAEICPMIRPGDIVMVHDPQTAGMVPALKRTGAPVVWRCHVGIDRAGPLARRAWRFLEGYLQDADAYVFSREAFEWDGLDRGRMSVIAPSIDAFSPKNMEMTGDQVTAILRAAGLMAGGRRRAAVYRREDGSEARIERRAMVFETQPIREETRFVLQVSRWDHLKDPLGVIQGFADHVAPFTDAHLVYAGPEVDAVADDPEGQAMLNLAVGLWRSLPDDRRARIHLVTLPMVDGDENAAIVNALQRQATVVVQKSLAEGFGLTVAEAMWKGRPVVASRIGGIQDQIEDEVTGVLLDDPTDLGVFGARTAALLRDEDRARSMGQAAMERVRADFLGSRSLVQWMKLFAGLIAAGDA